MKKSRNLGKKKEIDLLKMKVKDLETALEGMRKQNKNVDLKLHSKTKHNTLSVNCNFCKMVFSKKCDVELHLETEHNIKKEFKCDECEMSFVMRWRLQKHMGKHEQKTISKITILIMMWNAPLQSLAVCLSMKLPLYATIKKDALKSYANSSILI